ncbi:MAG: hypothetical protein IT299_13160 [Dehalococcoidia bacterium]|nr:hypothetical protein [Dehalococcoidia bacterium]
MTGKWTRWLSLGVLVALVTLFRARLCGLLGCDTEVIRISAPTNGASVTSPLIVTGWGRATQHNQLTIEVRDSSNTVVGTSTAAVTAALGQPGPFSGTVAFAAGASGSPGHVQVFDSSPATGAITHLASVLIRFA